MQNNNIISYELKIWYNILYTILEGVAKVTHIGHY